MSANLLTQISSNINTALILHRELADCFWFVYLPGYAMFQEYQYIAESIEQRKLKRYIGSTYGIYIPDTLSDSAEIANHLIGNKNRNQLSSEETQDIIKKCFAAHRDWETNSIQKYQKISLQLFDSVDISSFNFISSLIDDVKKELTFVTDKIIELNCIKFDMPQIVSEQDIWVERYEYLIKDILGKSEKYHHYNSNVDPDSRTTIFNKASN